MTMRHVSRARFRVADADAFIAFWLGEMEEHDLDFDRPTERSIEATTPYGTAQFRADGDPVEIELRSHAADLLVALREGVDAHLSEFDPALATVVWSGATGVGEVIANLARTRVAGVTPIGRSWLRLTLAGDDVARFAGPHHHVRLLRARTPGRAPVWPRNGARGAPEWPEGEDALVSRVYTIREVDVAAGRLTIDVARHAHGATAAWAAEARVGEEVGLVGPGGGGLPACEQIVAGGDETAAPAILRGLAALPRSASGQAVILTHGPEDVQRADAPDGVRVDWLFRARGEDLTTAMRAAVESAPADARLWFAASRVEADALRGWLRARGVPRDRCTCAVYWG